MWLDGFCPQFLEISGELEISDMDIRDFARKANADDFIIQMSQGVFPYQETEGWLLNHISFESMLACFYSCVSIHYVSPMYQTYQAINVFFPPFPHHILHRQVMMQKWVKEVYNSQEVGKIPENG